MAKLQYRLAEFFKKVDKSENEVKSKKAVSIVGETSKETIISVPVVEPKADIEVTSTAPTASAVSSTANVRVATRSATAVVDRPQAVKPDVKPKQIEPKTTPKPTYQVEAVVDTDKVESKLLLTPEGTGEPRPLSATGQTIQMPKAREIEELLEHSEHREQKTVTVETKPTIESRPEYTETVQDFTNNQDNWSRLPHHLQVLFSTPDSEVAQRSYKAFRDTRAQLIERLLDPSLTLEDTARILNVCPTTVRRYTNGDKLKHYRTAGNQRRFRLSDVLGFMETNNKSGIKPSSKRKPRGEE